MPGGRELKNDILNTSLCALCGACLDWCPYIKNLDDNMVITFDCNVEDGRCYAVCPRTNTDWKQVNAKFLDTMDWSKELGSFKKIYRVKSLDPVPGQQDGGAVSTLMKTALEEKLAEALLLTGIHKNMLPDPFIGTNLTDIEKAAGSKFLASTGLKKIMEASRQGIKNLLVVGRPCQIQALRKMQLYQGEQLKDMKFISIGLFCMWSLSWEFTDYLQREYPGLDIRSMAIPRHGLEITTNEGVKTIPTEKVREFIRPGCRYCLDMTSELADISVGAFESEGGWNTVIVRNTAGISLLRRAVEKGLLDVEQYPENELQLLKIASLNKKARNLTSIKELTASGKLSSPIDLSQFDHLEEVDS
ncbi:MAG: Coenzyme F420 hydrogenase/dehydrogenase, beta subunit C-terminal domain [Deltaproteobacteria bacterium]